MMNTNYSSFELKSSAEYKIIKSISFRPLKEMYTEKVVSNGDKRTWKLFGLIPCISYKAKKDLYVSFLWDGKKTLEDGIAQSFETKLFIKDNKVFRKARIIIEYLTKRTEWKYFDNDEEAMNYLENIKLRCKEVGNELK